MMPITEDLGRIDQAISMLEGYRRGIELLSSDLAPLEDREMFEDTEAQPLATFVTSLDHYLAALRWKKAQLDPNSEERIEQAARFSDALADVFGGLRII